MIHITWHSPLGLETLNHRFSNSGIFKCTHGIYLLDTYFNTCILYLILCRNGSLRFWTQSWPPFNTMNEFFNSGCKAKGMATILNTVLSNSLLCIQYIYREELSVKIFTLSFLLWWMPLHQMDDSELPITFTLDKSCFINTPAIPLTAGEGGPVVVATLLVCWQFPLDLTACMSHCCPETWHEKLWGLQIFVHNKQFLASINTEPANPSLNVSLVKYNVVVFGLDPQQRPWWRRQGSRCLNMSSFVYTYVRRSVTRRTIQNRLFVCPCVIKTIVIHVGFARIFWRVQLNKTSI